MKSASRMNALTFGFRAFVPSSGKWPQKNRHKSGQTSLPKKGSIHNERQPIAPGLPWFYGLLAGRERWMGRVEGGRRKGEGVEQRSHGEGTPIINHKSETLIVFLPW